ncbi:Uridine-cytidine kinase-like 1 [Geranomyces michiganensis]|nr:Uridine-cytidine kinase-like 1 [Geranomyces michiganensis]
MVLGFFEKHFEAADLPDLSGKVAIVTGGNTGIGYITCLHLAERNARVYMASRTKSRAEAAIEKIKALHPKAEVFWLDMDLMDLATVKRAAETFLQKEQRLDILVNNAGIMATPYNLTKDGVEEQFQTNHLGHFLFTTKLLPLLKQTAREHGSARIVNLSSLAHAQLSTAAMNFDTLENVNQEYGRVKGTFNRYGQSKLANGLFTVELDRRLKGENVFCNFVHPGVIATELHRGVGSSYGQWLSKLYDIAGRATLLTPYQGALTSLYAAASPEIVEKGYRARYFVPYAKLAEPSAYALDEVKAKNLWELSEKILREKGFIPVNQLLSVAAMSNLQSAPQGQRKTSTFLSSGRFPWYDIEGKPKEPFIIGMAGGSASGKTSVSNRIIRNLGVPWVYLLSMDSFYKPLTPEQSAAARRNEYDFDHPDAFDYEALFQTLLNLKKGVKVDVPIYDFSIHNRLDKSQTVYGANVVVFEGIFALYDKKVRDLMDLKIFVDTDADVRLARRLKRDIAERGRDIKGVLQQYKTFVKPAFDEHIYPTMKYADVIIPRGLDNVGAIDVLTKHLTRQLNDRGLTLKVALNSKFDANQELPANLRILKPTNELKALLTIIRDRTTSRHDFIFYAERLSRMIVERGLTELPFSSVDIPTPIGNQIYKGVVWKGEVCGVSIIRAGLTMEQGLRSVVKDIPIGKMLIQTDQSTGEPQLHYCKLPADITSRYVLVSDAQIATGAAALMAIRVIIDHEVPADRIIFLSLLASPLGLHTIARAFPEVRIVVAEVDKEIDEQGHLCPGFGNFGDRYFGTY